MDDPTLVLTRPVKADVSADVRFFSPTSIFDYLSISSGIFALIKELTGVDVVGELISPFVGHWDRVSEYGDALTKLAKCLEGVSGGMANAGARLDAQWDGNAADAAHVYFATAGTSLRLHSQALAAAGEKYQELASAMYQHHEAAAHLLKEAIDTAMEAMIWATLGAITAKTVVGGAVGFAMASAKVVHLLHVIDRWKALVVLAFSVAQGFVGVLYGFTRQVGSIEPIAVVSEPYRHPSERC